MSVKKDLKKSVKLKVKLHVLKKLCLGVLLRKRVVKTLLLYQNGFDCGLRL